MYNVNDTVIAIKTNITTLPKRFKGREGTLLYQSTNNEKRWRIKFAGELGLINREYWIDEEEMRKKMNRNGANRE